ncbi:MAG TPA: DUF6056 family protein [Ignavibacteria bacterium]|nr:DUF6056 family protein [Ignavibacteria bacterium]
MKNKFKTPVSENLLIIFLCSMILPFIILFFFNHPSADDWGLSENTKIRGFSDTQIHYYKNWTGKYFSNAVLSYNPLYFNSVFGYKMLTLLLLILFIYILYALIRQLSKNAISFKEKILLTLSIIFLYLYSMPSLSQSFYWLTASVVYQLGLIMIMMFLLLYSKITDPKDSTSENVLTFLSVLLLIAIAGCSEMSMVTGVLMISLLVLGKLITERKINGRLVLFTITTALSSYVLLSAPGNNVRGSQYPDSHKLIPSVITTITTMADYFVSWIFLSPLLFITLLTLPVLFKLVKNNEKKPVSIFVNPVYTVAAFLGVLFVLFFTPVWSLGRSPFNRTVNIIYFVFLIGWFYNVTVLIYLLLRKYEFKISRIPDFVYAVALVVVVLFLFKKNNVKNAYADILLGGASGYNKELNLRYDLIDKSTSDSLTVTPLVYTPRTIFFTDITADPELEFNRMYAHYFNKKYISVLKADTLKNE